MTLQIGRKGWLGIGKETTPGSPVNPDVYLVTLKESSLAEKSPSLGNLGAHGIREREYGESVGGKQWGEGATTLDLDESKIGHILLAGFGTVNTATVSGAIKDHTFSRNNSNTPQTYTLMLDRGTDRKIFPYSVAKSVEIAFTEELASVKVDWLSRFPITTASGSLTTVSGHLFSWANAEIRVGATIAAATAAAATKVSEFSMTIDNASEMTYRSGSREPASIDHGIFRVFGSIKLFFESTTELDNFRSQTKRAIEVKFTGRGLAGGLNESLTINLPKVRYEEATVETPIDGFVAIMLTFEAEYDATTTKMCDAVLRNITASY